MGEARGVAVRCSRQSCITDGLALVLGTELSIKGPYTARVLGTATRTPAREIGGLEIWEAAYDNGITDYGAWLDHSFFLIFGADMGEHTLVASAAFGRIYNDAPLPVEGTASYNGAMVGKDVITAANYAGAARLEVNFAVASLDAIFSDIADIATGERIADIEFPGVPLHPKYSAASAVDLPSAPGTATYINARFYGPENEEITGVFGKDTLIGAFGTKAVR